MYIQENNYYIRSQRIVNEWGIGFIINRYRLFLDIWAFEHEIFPTAYKTAAMM